MRLSNLLLAIVFACSSVHHGVLDLRVLPISTSTVYVKLAGLAPIAMFLWMTVHHHPALMVTVLFVRFFIILSLVSCPSPVYQEVFVWMGCNGGPVPAPRVFMVTDVKRTSTFVSPVHVQLVYVAGCVITHARCLHIAYLDMANFLGSTCVDDLLNYVCQCPSGRQGITCEEVASGCDSSPCQEGATCVDGPEGIDIMYSCECPDGFTGALCDQPPDPCASNPCIGEGSTCSAVLADVLAPPLADVCQRHPAITAPPCNQIDVSVSQGDCVPSNACIYTDSVVKSCSTFECNTVAADRGLCTRANGCLLSQLPGVSSPPTLTLISGSQCGPGTSDDGASCVACLPGTYSDAVGYPVCQPCPPGTFAPGTGATFCGPCPDGTVPSSPVADSCTPAAPIPPAPVPLPPSLPPALTFTCQCVSGRTGPLCQTLSPDNFGAGTDEDDNGAFAAWPGGTAAWAPVFAAVGLIFCCLLLGLLCCAFMRPKREVRYENSGHAAEAVADSSAVPDDVAGHLRLPPTADCYDPVRKATSSGNVAPSAVPESNACNDELVVEDLESPETAFGQLTSDPVKSARSAKSNYSGPKSAPNEVEESASSATGQPEIDPLLEYAEMVAAPVKPVTPKRMTTPHRASSSADLFAPRVGTSDGVAVGRPDSVPAVGQPSSAADNDAFASIPIIPSSDFPPPPSDGPVIGNPIDSSFVDPQTPGTPVTPGSPGKRVTMSRGTVGAPWRGDVGSRNLASRGSMNTRERARAGSPPRPHPVSDRPGAGPRPPDTPDSRAGSRGMRSPEGSQQAPFGNMGKAATSKILTPTSPPVESADQWAQGSITSLQGSPSFRASPSHHDAPHYGPTSGYLPADPGKEVFQNGSRMAHVCVCKHECTTTFDTHHFLFARLHCC